MTLRVAFAVVVATLAAGCTRKPEVAATPVVPTPINQQSDLKALVEVAGQYTLVSVDGRALPMLPLRAEVSQNPATEIASSSLLVRGDGSIQMVVRYRDVTQSNGQYTERVYTGTCFAAGPYAYRLAFDGAGTTDVSLVGDRLILDNEGMQFSYTRRR